MANHPLNLALRFFLDLAALAAIGRWGWTQHTGLVRLLLALGLLVIAAAASGIFRAPGYLEEAVVAMPGRASTGSFMSRPA
jgi:hypothetical protein